MPTPRGARLFDRQGDACEARVALEAIGPALEKQEAQILKAACVAFRVGNLDAQAALIAIGQLVALADLREELERSIRRGNRALDELMRSEPQPGG